MIILDTDCLTLLKYPDPGEEGRTLQRRLDDPAVVGPSVAVISIEEQMRGWLAVIAKERMPSRQVRPYRELEDLFAFFADFDIVSFDEAAAEKFLELRKMKLRIGAMDLKIAAIRLVNDATLLTRNARDFSRVPGLKIDDWTR